MREILFRGKRSDNGEWVEGDLSQHKTGKKFIKSGSALQSYQVIPETVGQYTGLTDKNGRKIFEGDILAWIDRLVYVTWLKGNAQFDCNFIKHINDTKVVNFKGIEPRDWRNCEIVGNIHDNPELLKGGEAE